MTGPAQSAQELYDALILRHGGYEALSPIDVEVVGIIVKLLATARAAAPGDLPRIAATIAKLRGQLRSVKRGPAAPSLAQYLAALNGGAVPTAAEDDPPTLMPPKGMM